MKKYTNALINESSPYLLQHAHNPVNWHPWRDDLFDLAKKENKLVLISIGYSACHWCHVMEKECFENPEVAALMNAHFINIKVDREERPDVDMIYMSAVQLMAGQGGWPLNCFVLPNGKPIYGGTYFPKERWISILKNLHNLFQEQKEKVEEYANELTEGIKQIESVTKRHETKNRDEIFRDAIHTWSKHFDYVNGGPNRAPKFPLPNNYEFLLKYGLFSNDENLLNYTELTLNKMAMGGIYDHIGGGFARYSVDGIWKVPHFEKMLYDNAQLMALYARAWRQYKKPLYKDTAFGIADFLLGEMQDKQGGFFAALDADSEGVEGKYYIWEEEEFTNVCGTDAKLMKAYFSINENGYWEHDTYIPMLTFDDDHFAREFQIPEDVWHSIKEKNRLKLLAKRETRVKPGLDHKIICSWNGLTITGFCELYLSFNRVIHLETAKKIAAFIEDELMDDNGELWHVITHNKKNIRGFLEDYAFTIEGFLTLYRISGIEKYAILAQKLMEFSIENFLDENTGMFWFKNKHHTKLIADKFELTDNVIPSSNSQMARNLLNLSSLFSRKDYQLMGERMVNCMQEEIRLYPSGHSNWALASLDLQHPPKEAVIVGKNVNQFMDLLGKTAFSNANFVFSQTGGTLPITEGRYQEGKTLAYVCRYGACNLPVENPVKAIEEING